MVEKVAIPAESLREIISVASDEVSRYEKDGLSDKASELDSALHRLIGLVTLEPDKDGEFVSVPANCVEIAVSASGWTDYHKGLQSQLEAYGVWG